MRRFGPMRFIKQGLFRPIILLVPSH